LLREVVRLFELASDPMGLCEEYCEPALEFFKPKLAGLLH
jgi:hypothetical protein